MSLLDHRTELYKNPEAYDKGLDRAVWNLTPHLKKAGYPAITPMKSKPARQELVELIFAAQRRRPFLFIESKLPYCWNSPMKGGWDVNYIKYEWGHLRSINQNPDSAFDVENLCLMSARCNQHIQSSLDIDELLAYGGALESVIRRNMAARDDLFASEKWNSLLTRLSKFK
ncbi:MAG: hypothetical protein IH945_06860 [Armatimonadetes bacterium]|nr:hypothetical protein [Armatimonadota bacterium]